MNQEQVKQHIQQKTANYFQSVDNNAKNLYQEFLTEFEEPFLSSVLEQLNGNQSKAAIALGISRSTLRKRLNKYALI